MKKRPIILYCAIIVAVLSVVLQSCEDDVVATTDGNEGVSEKQLKSILDDVTTDWEKTEDAVRKKSKGYDVISGTEDDILQLQSGSVSITYQFFNGHLCASAVLYPSGNDIDLSKIMAGFTYIGDMEGGQVYQNSSNNTLAIMWQPIDTISNYNSVGFAPISSVDLDAMVPINVTTVSVEPGMITARATGEVTGTEQEVEVGFIHSTTPDLDENNGKMVSTMSSGEFQLDMVGLMDGETNYFCAYALVDGQYVLGETVEFQTEPLEYSINGQNFKMVKVEGGPLGDFSIMQTELPPSSPMTIAGMTIDRLDENRDEVVIKRDFRRFLVNLCESTGIDFRLPTPEEWQYAAMGGNKSQGFTYSGSNEIDDVAWYSHNSDRKIQPLAQKQPNELGLYDMSGNYSELTIDEETLAKDIYDVDGDFYGGNCQSSSGGCKPTSMVKGSRDGLVANSKSLREQNAFDARVSTVRLVYSRK